MSNWVPPSSEDGSFAAAMVGFALAVPIWALVFRSQWGNFWARMTAGAGSLGLFALRRRPELRRELPRPGDALLGAGSAAALYVIFLIGDRLSRVVMPAGEEDIEAIYRLRTLAPRPLIAVALAAVIGPSEELFWRGLLQHALMRRFGRVRGTALAASAYGATHLVTANLTLTGAASVAGAFWGAEYALDERMAPLLASHIIWDLWIFLIAPTPTGRRSRS